MRALRAGVVGILLAVLCGSAGGVVMQTGEGAAGIPRGTAPASAVAPPDPAPVPPGEPDPRTQPVTLEQLPPLLRLGARSALIRRNLAVIPVVVVVPDAASYAAAVSRWAVEGRFPVFIDDGSWEARQDIARFVRAFRPESVVRWRAPEGERDWPGEPEARRRLIANAVARAWGAADADKLRARWDELQLTPPGVVVLSESDPAWTAGLALAAGRGQLLVWTPRPDEPPNWHLQMAVADALSQRIEAACEASGYAWRSLGDELDAITLCLNLAIKIDLGASDQRRMLATSDVIGRERAGDRTKRWAWTGQVFGTEAKAAYRAMCALYLRPRNAWLFDGYENNPPWSGWDMTAAARELERAQIATVVNDDGPQGADDFRRRAAGRFRGGSGGGDGGAADGGSEGGGGGGGVLGGSRFGMILVNSSGEPAWFDLRPGRALAGDAPLMARPAAVYFVHSWSATRPEDRATVAGRFLEHGAYAYMGSVHEPYLQGFVPTPLFSRRFALGGPWGGAGRMDEGPPWKIAVIGDPLITMGPDPAILDAARLPLAGAEDVQASMAAALRAREFDKAIADLVLLGRDDDTVRLVRALLAEREGDGPTPELSPAAARDALPSLYFAGAFDLVTRIYPIAARAPERPEALRDVLWHTLWPSLTVLRPGEAALLRDNLRADPMQMARDAAEVAAALEHAFGPAAAQAFIAEARALMPNDDARRWLTEFLRK